jgi:hypothetical protein
MHALVTGLRSPACRRVVLLTQHSLCRAVQVHAGFTSKQHNTVGPLRAPGFPPNLFSFYLPHPCLVQLLTLVQAGHSLANVSSSRALAAARLPNRSQLTPRTV